MGIPDKIIVQGRTFTVGERVEFVEDYGRCKKGDRGAVERCTSGGTCVQLRMDDGRLVATYPRRVKAVRAASADPKFAPGDKVRVVSRVNNEPGWENIWHPRMDSYVGHTYFVSRVLPTGVWLAQQKGALGTYGFPPGSLELVKDEAPAVAFKIGDRVKIARKSSWSGWQPSMDSTVGMCGTVEDISHTPGHFFVVLESAAGAWFYTTDSLEAAPKPSRTLLDLTKPLQARCGYPARILDGSEHIDNEGATCFVVMFDKGSKGKQAHTMYADGRYLKDGAEHALDMQNVPPAKPRVSPKMIEVTPEEAVVLSFVLGSISGSQRSARGLTESLHKKLAAAFRVDNYIDMPGCDIGAFPCLAQRDSLRFDDAPAEPITARLTAQLKAD